MPRQDDNRNAGIDDVCARQFFLSSIQMTEFITAVLRRHSHTHCTYGGDSILIDLSGHCESKTSIYYTIFIVELAY